MPSQFDTTLYHTTTAGTEALALQKWRVRRREALFQAKKVRLLTTGFRSRARSTATQQRRCPRVECHSCPLRFPCDFSRRINHARHEFSLRVWSAVMRAGPRISISGSKLSAQWRLTEQRSTLDFLTVPTLCSEMDMQWRRVRLETCGEHSVGQ